MRWIVPADRKVREQGRFAVDLLESSVDELENTMLDLQGEIENLRRAQRAQARVKARKCQ